MLFDHTSLNIAFPILTLLFFDMQSSLFAADTPHAVRSMWYGFCVAVPHLINLFVTPILSILSDTWGRKKILLLGMLGALLFALTAAFGVVFGSLSLLFLGRIIQGAFSRTNPIAQAVIGDISENHTKVIYMGYLQSAICLGAFIGPVMGGYFANKFFFKSLNFSLPYFIAALFAAMAFFLTLTQFKETLPEYKSILQKKFFDWPSFKKIFSEPGLGAISLLLLLSQISWSLYYQFIPPLLKTELGFSAQQLGWFVGMTALWLALASSFGIRLLNQWLRLGQILRVAIYLLLLGLLFSVWSCFFKSAWIWLAVIPTAIGDVITYSCLITLYSNLVEKQNQGKVMAICFVIVALIWALTGLLGGALMSAYALLPLLIAPIGAFAALLVFYYLPRISFDY